MPGPVATITYCRSNDATAVVPWKGAAAWVSSQFEEWTMWERNSVRERGASRRDVVCAWLIALAVLGGLMLLTAVQPLISGQSTQEANRAAAVTQEKAVE